MQLNKDKVRELMDEYFLGNYNRFGRELDVDPANLHRFLTRGITGSIKIVGAVMKFCKDKVIEFNDFIEITEESTNSNFVYLKI